ncbi:malonic semialdehyde reductase [Demequina sp.]|uniref:malonic semialdehyde reductase n=1 Tax=Demequina sp. TaxID=2050685 RepID=UPI003A8A5497
MSTNFAIDAAARATLFTDARSNLVFADRPVAMETVREVWDLIKWGPTANNTVPLRVLAASSDTARAAVLDAAAAGNRDKIVAAPLVLVAARDERFHETFGITGGSETAAARFEADPEARTRFSHTNTMLQTGYLILGLRAAGLAVRPVGGFDRNTLDAALFADASWRSELLLLVGYPAQEHGAGERKGRMSADAAVREA